MNFCQKFELFSLKKSLCVENGKESHTGKWTNYATDKTSEGLRKRSKPVIGNTLNFQKWKKSLKLWSTLLSFCNFFSFGRGYRVWSASNRASNAAGSDMGSVIWGSAGQITFWPKNTKHFRRQINKALEDLLIRHVCAFTIDTERVVPARCKKKKSWHAKV